MMLKRSTYGTPALGLSKPLLCRWTWGVAAKPTAQAGVEHAPSADLGCSSEYSIENIED